MQLLISHANKHTHSHMYIDAHSLIVRPWYEDVRTCTFSIFQFLRFVHTFIDDDDNDDHHLVINQRNHLNSLKHFHQTISNVNHSTTFPVQN